MSLASSVLSPKATLDAPVVRSPPRLGYVKSPRNKDPVSRTFGGGHKIYLPSGTVRRMHILRENVPPTREKKVSGYCFHLDCTYAGFTPRYWPSSRYSNGSSSRSSETLTLWTGACPRVCGGSSSRKRGPCESLSLRDTTMVCSV